MPDTISAYNHTRKKLWDLSLVDEAGNFYVMLLDGTTAFSAAHTTVDQASDTGADEVDGNGWDAGGESIADLAVSIVSTSGAKIDATDISVTATGGDIGPASAALIYVDEGGLGSTKTPLFHLAFDPAKTAALGDPFTIQWDAAGIASSVPEA
jgi:hypothetical protein